MTSFAETLDEEEQEIFYDNLAATDWSVTEEVEELSETFRDLGLVADSNEEIFEKFENEIMALANASSRLNL
jgi:hypothetical protein